MKCSEKGLALLKQFESCKLEAYPDPATGGEPYSIGFGDTCHVYDGMRITFAEALRRLQVHLEPLEAQITHLVRVPLTQSAFDALVCLAYNIGIGNFERSTLLKRLNAGDTMGAADAFRDWTHAAGRELAGLVRRREAERALFLSA
jgi:lysozyme